MFSAPPPVSKNLCRCKARLRRPTVNGSMEKAWSPAVKSIFLSSMLMNFTWLSEAAGKFGSVFWKRHGGETESEGLRERPRSRCSQRRTYVDLQLDKSSNHKGHGSQQHAHHHLLQGAADTHTEHTAQLSTGPPPTLAAASPQSRVSKKNSREV